MISNNMSMLMIYRNEVGSQIDEEDIPDCTFGGQGCLFSPKKLAESS